MTLKQFFEENEEVAIAFSGGVDSAYLLYAAVTWAKRVHAYYVKTVFQPEFEFCDAKRLVTELSAEWSVLQPDIFRCKEIVQNPKNRCYYCKTLLMTEIIRAASQDGFSLIADGTNASDDISDRPGMKALCELGVKSPLRECGLTKEVIRERSRQAGLFTWDKPAYACLATRIPWGDEITEEKLARTERAEAFLMSLGFRDIRVRNVGKMARLQVKKEQLPALISRREEVVTGLKPYFEAIMLDLEQVR